jgi:ankyrin repeat protein/mono/diheme cytochrome c family protein
MWAARNGYEDVAQRLVKGGADLNLKNGDNASAAMVAMYNDRFDLAAMLVDLGSDVNDGSLYTAVEMRESTTDQFAFDGSRLRPSHPNKLTALDLVKLLMDRGGDPHKIFTGQFHSTSMPNNDRFNNSAFFRAAVASDVETLKVMIAHGIDLDQIPVLPPPPPDDTDDAAGGRGRGNPNAGKTAAMVTMTGGRGPAMTGGPGYIRSGTVPYREPGSRKPLDAFVLLLKAGANPNAKAPDGSTLLHQAAAAANLDMIRALADAKVKFDEPNKDGLTALDIAEGKRPAGAKAEGARGAAPPAAGGARGRGGRGGTTPQDVAKLLRELMGLPPAPPAPAPREHLRRREKRNEEGLLFAFLQSTQAWESGIIPLLASPQGGVAASLRKRREATEADADGVVFHSCAIGKPPRPRDQRRLRDILFGRSATPPCLRLHAIALALRGGDARRVMALLENGVSSAISLVVAVLTLASVGFSQTPSKVALPAANVVAEPAAYQEMLNKYCITCHNEKARIPAGAPLALDKANLNDPGATADVWEKVVRKLGVGAMPPRNSPRLATRN